MLNFPKLWKVSSCFPTLALNRNSCNEVMCLDVSAVNAGGDWCGRVAKALLHIFCDPESRLSFRQIQDLARSAHDWLYSISALGEGAWNSFLFFSELRLKVRYLGFQNAQCSLSWDYISHKLDWYSYSCCADSGTTSKGSSQVLCMDNSLGVTCGKFIHWKKSNFNITETFDTTLQLCYYCEPVYSYILYIVFNINVLHGKYASKYFVIW